MKLSLFIIAGFLCLSGGLIAQQSSLNNPFPLVFKKEVQAQLKAGDVHRYTLRLEAGQFARLCIHQQTVGIAYTVFAPNDSILENADLNAIYQTEIVTIEARQAGNYCVEVYWDYAKPASGQYSIVWDKMEKAAKTPATRARQLFEGWHEAEGPAAVLAILQNGKVIYKGIRGMADMEHGIPVTASSLFDLASVSKQFTGYAIAMLINKGQLSLDDDIRKFLPELPDYGKPILLRHLVYHTSGLRNWDDMMNASGYQTEDILTMDMIIRMVSTNRYLNFNPGDNFSYSNTGYNLLARIVERVSGHSFAVWSKENIFQPLGMSNTRIKDNLQSVIPGRVYSYKASAEGFKTMPDNLSAPGSSSLYSSIDDLVKWVNNLEQTNSPDGKKIISIINTKGQLNNGNTVDYAFGNFISQHKGTAKIEHLGLWSGFRTSVVRYPEEGIAVIYLTADANDATYQRAWTIAELFLKNIKRPPVKRNQLPDIRPYLAKIEPVVPEKDPAKLAPFEGVYFARELNTAFTLKVINGMLSLLAPRIDTVSLRQLKQDEFSSTSPQFNRRLVFQRDSAQKISSFILTTGGRGIVFNKLQ